MKQLRAAGDNGPQARKLLDTLFRQVHNLKASASANGLTTLARAAHEFENILHSLRVGQPTIDGNAISAEVWKGLKQDQKHAVQQSIAEGARLFLVQTDLDVDDFERQFQSLKEMLSKSGEVISTLPSVKKERPEKVNFRILYAASQSPTELPCSPALIVEEMSVITPTAADSFAQQLSVLENAFAKFAPELAPIPVGDVLAQALRAGEAAAKATGKEVDFELRGDPGLLNQPPGECFADPLMHLVRNAVDHGIETRGKVIIEIAKRDDSIAITVTDDGRGIDPSLIERIFQPGFSTATEVSHISGRGVGLDVVKTTIEELGGSISVRSAPGQGASFELTLPIRSA